MGCSTSKPDKRDKKSSHSRKILKRKRDTDNVGFVICNRFQHLSDHFSQEKNISKIKNVLKSNMSGLMDSHINCIYDNMESVILKSTIKLYRKGELVDYLYYIHSGKAYYENDDYVRGKKVPFVPVQVGNSLVYPTEFFEQSEAQNVVSCFQNSVVYRIHKTRYDEITQQFKEILLTPKFKFVRSLAICTGYSTNDCYEFMQCLDEVSYKDGDLIIKKGDVGDQMYFIFSGKVKIDLETKEIAVDFLKPPQYFGEIALLFSAPRRATIFAVGDTMLYSLHRDHFVTLAHAHEIFMRNMKNLKSMKVNKSDGYKSNDVDNEVQSEEPPTFMNKLKDKKSKLKSSKKNREESKDQNSVISFLTSPASLNDKTNPNLWIEIPDLSAYSPDLTVLTSFDYIASINSLATGVVGGGAVLFSPEVDKIKEKSSDDESSVSSDENSYSGADSSGIFCDVSNIFGFNFAGSNSAQYDGEAVLL